MASERESPALRKARERRLRAVASLEKAVRNLEGVSATSQASAGSGGPPVPQDEPPQSAVETAEDAASGDEPPHLTHTIKRAKAVLNRSRPPADAALGGGAAGTLSSSGILDDDVLDDTMTDISLPAALSASGGAGAMGTPAERVLALQHDRDEAVKCCLQYRSKLQEAKERVRAKDETIRQLRRDVEDATQTRAKAKKLFDDIMGKVKLNVEHQLKLENKSKHELAERTHLSAEARSARDRVEELELELRRVSEAHGALQQNVVHLEAERSAQSGEIDAMLQRHSEVEGLRGDAESRSAGLEQENATLLEGVDAAARRAAELEHERDDARRAHERARELSEEVEQMRAEVAAARTREDEARRHEEREADAARGARVALVEILVNKGVPLKKHGARGSPTDKRLFIELQRAHLFWCDEGKQRDAAKPGKSIALKNAKLIRGKTTPALKRASAKKASPDHCFSIIAEGCGHGERATLDLEARNVDERDELLRCFQHLLDHLAEVARTEQPASAPLR